VFVHMPLMYFPAYYTIKEFVFGESWSPVDWARTGVGKYVGNFREDFTAMAKVRGGEGRWGGEVIARDVILTKRIFPFVAVRVLTVRS